MTHEKHRSRGGSLQQEVERLETAPWRAPRGWKTKLVAWIIIISFALTIVAMIIALIAVALRNSRHVMSGFVHREPTSLMHVNEAA